MSNSILPFEGLSKLTGQTGNQNNTLKDILKSKQEADNLEKGFSANKNLDDAYSPSANAVRAAAAMKEYQAAYQYSQTMSLQLQTKEGDVVTVDFRQLYAHYEAYKEEQAGAEGPSGVRYFESREALEATQFEEQFGFSVEGDLNEDELKAIFDVFEQVDELATNFFNGDVEQAFQQAVEMDVDFGQLQSFNLNLQQTQTVAASYKQAAAYQGVQESSVENADETDSGEATVADLPPYLQRLQDAVENMDAFFEEARSIVEEFMADIQAQRNPDDGEPKTWLDRLKAFHDQLVEKANLDENTLKPSGVVVNPESEVISEETNEETDTPLVE